jgi:hypothetical protein
MTFVEVQNIVGDPHEKRTNVDGTISWWYFVRSSLSPLMDGSMEIQFDAGGRVMRMLNDH